MRPAAAGAPTRLLVAVAGLFSIGIGCWAFFDPGSFFDRVALFPPYNVHLLHDVGAFQVGLGLALWLALVWTDALLVVLSASGAAATLHVAAHVIDRDLGGHPLTDITGLGLLALLLLVAAAMRYRRLRGRLPDR
jgi:hypothetical protein